MMTIIGTNMMITIASCTKKMSIGSATMMKMMVERRKREGDTTMKMAMVKTTKKMTTGLVRRIKMMVERSKRKGDTKKDDHDLHQDEDENGQYHHKYDNQFSSNDEDDDQKYQKKLAPQH